MLLTSTNDLLEKHNVEFELAELNTAIYKFLNNRFREVSGPFVVDAAPQTESLNYAAAFITGDQLVLVYVTQLVNALRSEQGLP